MLLARRDAADATEVVVVGPPVEAPAGSRHAAEPADRLRSTVGRLGSARIRFRTVDPVPDPLQRIRAWATALGEEVAASVGRLQEADPASTAAALRDRPDDEQARQHALDELHIVGSPPDPRLDDLVELCGAPWTSPDAIERARKIYREIGQVPVTINREINGFVLNRLQGALLSEALRLVGEGIVGPHDLDKTVKDGLGLRWSFLGPFETIELNAPGGIADYCARYGGFYRRLAADAPKPEVWDEASVARVLAAWDETPAADRLAAKSAWRDARLTALRAHKAAQTPSDAA